MLLVLVKSSFKDENQKLYFNEVNVTLGVQDKEEKKKDKEDEEEKEEEGDSFL